MACIGCLANLLLFALVIGPSSLDSARDDALGVANCALLNI